MLKKSNNKDDNESSNGKYSNIKSNKKEYNLVETNLWAINNKTMKEKYIEIERYYLSRLFYNYFNILNTC